MRQTENTAIVLRWANYRDNDRMLTLLSPTRGLVTALSRGCRKPRSSLLNASELFALGDYQLYERGEHLTVTSVSLIETFYPLRHDFDRLACGTYLLNLAEAAAQPEQEQQELFMLLLHTLSRLTFSNQEWKPLLTGFLLHYTNCQGFKPRLEHCVSCGRKLRTEDRVLFDEEEGGACCADCAAAPGRKCALILPEQMAWLRMAIASGSASWVNTEGMTAPFTLMRRYVERRLEHRFHSAAMLPDA